MLSCQFIFIFSLKRQLVKSIKRTPTDNTDICVNTRDTFFIIGAIRINKKITYAYCSTSDNCIQKRDISITK